MLNNLKSFVSSKYSYNMKQAKMAWVQYKGFLGLTDDSVQPGSLSLTKYQLYAYDFLLCNKDALIEGTNDQFYIENVLKSNHPLRKYFTGELVDDGKPIPRTPFKKMSISQKVLEMIYITGKTIELLSPATYPAIVVQLWAWSKISPKLYALKMTQIKNILTFIKGAIKGPKKVDESQVPKEILDKAKSKKD